MARTNEKLWKRIVASVKAGSKGGRPGQWSARKAQLAGKKYKAAGGGYSGEKTKAQKSMTKWTKQDWGTKSGKNSIRGKNATGERYLPKAERNKLTKAQYAATTRKKQADLAKGKKVSQQPKKIKKKLNKKK